MTLSGLALLLALGVVLWALASVVVSFGLSALVARNRTGLPGLAPSAATSMAARSRRTPHAA